MTIHLQNLVHSYKSPAAESRKVIDIPNWRVAPGAQILLRGISGSGKTTLFNIIAGLLKPSSGEVHYHDKSLYQMSEVSRDRFRAKNIGYIFQTHYLLGTLTAIENVTMPMAFARYLPRAQWHKQAHELLMQVGLGDYIDYRPHQLSTGQRMRVAVVRALANNPGIVLADEPTASLDAESATTVMTLIQQTCTANNAILLVASHDPALDPNFDQIVELNMGHITSQNTFQTEAK